MKALDQFKMPRWEELPSFDLHLEQVLLLIDEWMGDYLDTGKSHIITKTMVNNYVKLKYIPAPVNKKYNRLSVASLFVIAILKSVFTIEESSKLIHLALDFHDTAGSAYNQFCGLIEEAVIHAAHGTSMEKPENPDDPRNLYWNLCNAFACWLYVKHVYFQNINNQ